MKKSKKRVNKGKKSVEKHASSSFFKSTTTRDMLAKMFKLSPNIQRISGLKPEGQGKIPDVGRYNPNYRTVEGQIKGNVQFKHKLVQNKVLEKKRKLIHQYATDLKKRLAEKDTRSAYISSLLKMSGTKTSGNEDSPGRQYNKKDSVVSTTSDYSLTKASKPGKVNIHSLSTAVMRERKKSEAYLNKDNSLPRLTSNASTSPDTKKNHRLASIIRQASTMSSIIKKIKPVKHQSRKSRIQQDIFKWVMKRANASSEEEFNPYNLKKILFDSSEANPMCKSRCKSVVPFHKQLQRPPFRDLSDCHEKRFEYVDDSANNQYWSKNKHSGSPDIAKYSKRREITQDLALHTYDVNYESTKRSLANGVPDFRRYIDRPTQVKKLITPDYNKSLEQIYRSQSRKERTVSYQKMKPRDDMMYKNVI